MAQLLEIDRLTVGFPGLTSPVLDEVSLTVGEGEVLALVGESGSGKSMTAMSIMQMLPAPATTHAEALRVAGVDVLRASKRDLDALHGGKVGMLFQQPKRMLDPTCTVGKQVAEPLRLHLGMNRPTARRHVLELLSDVGIDDPARRAAAYPHELSGGLAQRVMIAAALAAQPRLLIADEPTTALDVTVEAQILQLIADKVADLRMSVLFISHDLGVVSSIADRIAVMYAGRIVEQGKTADIMSNPQHPYTRALIQCSLLNPDASGQLYVIPDPPSQTSGVGCLFAPRCHLASEAHVDHQCTASVPELIPAPGAEDGHETRCWATHNLRASA